MHGDKQKMLVGLLEEYFAAFDFEERNFLNRNQVARTLKERLKVLNRWKDKPRGNPKRPKKEFVCPF